MKAGRCLLELKMSSGPVSHSCNCWMCFLCFVFVIFPDNTEQRWDLIYFCGQPSETPGQADQFKGQLLPLVVNRIHTDAIKSPSALLCHLKNAWWGFFFDSLNNRHGAEQLFTTV